MALVHNDVTVIRNEVFDVTFSLQALNYGHINRTSSLVLSSAELSDTPTGKIQECCQSLAPLVHQLTTVYENQRVDSSLPDHICTNNGLSERRRRTQYALVVSEHLSTGFLLFRSQLGLKRHVYMLPCCSFILNLCLYAVVFEDSDHLFDAPPRETDVFGETLATGYDSWFAVRRESHSLSFVEFWILKSRDPNQAI